MKENSFSKQEIKFMIGVSSTLGFRQIGLMLVLPFISIYGKTLQGSSPGLVGLSLGIYGLVQGCLQIPYGLLSDRLGRKPIVIAGLLQLVGGMVLASYARNIYIFIMARALQGSGAVNAAAISWVADRIDYKKSNRAMGIVSTVIGGATAFSIISGTILQKYLSVPQIFFLCAVLVLLAVGYISFVVKEGKRQNKAERALKKTFKWRDMFSGSVLKRLYAIGFILNFILIGMFYVLPQQLEIFVGKDGLWIVFVPAVIFALPVVSMMNKYGGNSRQGRMQSMAFAGLTAGTLTLFFQNGIIIGLGVIIFFSGFVCLNALQNSCINMVAGESIRGGVNGVSNTMQFSGSFLGGTVTGILWGVDKNIAVLVLLVLSICGIIIALSFKSSTFTKIESDTSEADVYENGDYVEN